MATNLKRYRFTVTEYHQMGEAGIFTEDDRVELLDGEIFEMTPIGISHAAVVYRTSDLFNDLFRPASIVGVKNPIALSEHSEPQPDLALLRRKSDYYASGHPTPQDVFLLVEVADSSTAADRRIKIPLYARGGIKEVWLVDIQHDSITIYRDPASDGYRTVQVSRRGERIAPVAFPDRAIAVADILP